MKDMKKIKIDVDANATPALTALDEVKKKIQEVASLFTTKITTEAKTEKTETLPTAAVKVENVTPVIEQKAEEAKELPGVPGAVGSEEESGKYDGGYAEEKHTDPVDHEEPDGDEDGDECECSYCKGTGKMKKAKHVEEEESGKYDGGYAKKAEEAEEEEEEDETPHAPKKMELPSTDEWKAAFGIKKQAVSKEKQEWDGAVRNTFSGQTFNQ